MGDRLANMSRILLQLLVINTLLFCSYASIETSPKLQLEDGHQMPVLALGTWLGVDSQGRVKPTGDEVEKAVTWAIEAGYRHIDTAHIYDTERQVGRAVNAKISDGTVSREEMFITTKLWNDKHAKEDVLPALLESLTNMNLSYVDLYLIHWPVGQYENGTYDLTDYLETWEGMVVVKKAGLAKCIGLSNFNQEQMDRIIDTTSEKPSVLQVEINLNLQQPELLAYCKRKGVQVTGYTPFGSLFRSKAKPDAPPPRIDDPALLALAGKYNKTAAQINLRYILNGLDVVPLPKSLTKSRIKENFGIFDFQLDEEDIDKLKAFDANYRTIPQLKWIDHPYYPFTDIKTKNKQN